MPGIQCQHSSGGQSNANSEKFCPHPVDEKDRVFERFHRVDTRLSRTTQGVGLGLYICRVIVEAHGGQIWVESDDTGRGSTFNIRLPR